MKKHPSRKERAQIVQSQLEALFPSPEIPLVHTSPFTLLIAVLLSAQCTDAKVNKVTPSLFKRASTPAAMAALPIEEIETLIRPCGLSRMKSKAIHHLSKLLIEKHRGKVPTSFEALEALPGVGHKTASVVRIQAFGKPAFPVDTHIHRCAHRWGLADGHSVESTEASLKRLFKKETWGKVHLQIILYARRYCPARGHRIETCPICHALEAAPKELESHSHASLHPADRIQKPRVRVQKAK